MGKCYKSVNGQLVRMPIDSIPPYQRFMFLDKAIEGIQQAKTREEHHKWTRKLVSAFHNLKNDDAVRIEGLRRIMAKLG